jgi:hypothetical protein
LGSLDIWFTPDSGANADIARLQRGPIGDIARLAQRAFSFTQRDHRAADARLTLPGSAVGVAGDLVDPQGYEGTDETQHENAGSRYGDQGN